MTTIRTATAADLPSMHAAANAFYASSKALRHFDINKFASIWTQFLEVNFGVIFLAEADGLIVGALGGVIHPDLYGSELIAEEFFWFIQAESRGSGLKLYAKFEEWARSRGAVEIQMVHLLDLMPEKVGTFYRRAGYSPIETRYSKRLAA